MAKHSLASNNYLNSKRFQHLETNTVRTNAHQWFKLAKQNRLR